MYSYIERWDSSSVASWVHSIGYGQYEKRFRGGPHLIITSETFVLLLTSRFEENDITGEILLNTDLDMLKELKIKSIGHRIAILKAVRHLRVENGYDAIPVDEDPLSATQGAFKRCRIIFGTVQNQKNRNEFRTIAAYSKFVSDRNSIDGLKV